MSNVAIIPARGGSKRIPRKNIRAFADKPMIAHSIEAALRSQLFDKVIVSTDDENIAHIARQYGAEVPFIRPAELSDDYTGTSEVIIHALRWLLNAGIEPKFACCIYATAPLITQDDLLKGFNLIEQGNWQYVFAATSFGFPIFRGFEKQNDHSLKMFFPEFFLTRSQDLPHAMHDAGQFYWGLTQAWLEKVNVFGPGSTIVELPRWRVQDIDTLEDWERAQMIYQFIRQSKEEGVALD